MSNDTSTDEKSRDGLKLQILTSKARHIEDIINAKMDEIEELTKVYTETLDRINKIKYTPDHIEQMQTLMNRLKGTGSTPDSYAQCNSSDQMINRMMHDVKKLEVYESKVARAAAAEGVAVPSLSNNAEVFQRMRSARKAEAEAEAEAEAKSALEAKANTVEKNVTSGSDSDFSDDLGMANPLENPLAQSLVFGK
jgi:SPX domain protein involved in polyphosphate accumulation